MGSIRRAAAELVDTPRRNVEAYRDSMWVALGTPNRDGAFAGMVERLTVVLDVARHTSVQPLSPRLGVVGRGQPRAGMTTAELTFVGEPPS
ncbi:hypothetical protein AB0H83_47195 [Dactylosporangium sp. NPDC050688]|uniref:hypothetical protein n=1 Tax=Dactylosporangium sp. NPDC050688 TaxID=3157217 RepID=UPI003411E9CA